MRAEMAASGGYGVPFLREPSAVAEDVAEQKISRTRALEKYGVVIDAVSGQLDAQGTREVRSRPHAPMGNAAKETTALAAANFVVALILSGLVFLLFRRNPEGKQG